MGHDPVVLVEQDEGGTLGRRIRAVEAPELAPTAHRQLLSASPLGPGPRQHLPSNGFNHPDRHVHDKPYRSTSSHNGSGGYWKQDRIDYLHGPTYTRPGRKGSNASSNNPGYGLQTPKSNSMQQRSMGAAEPDDCKNKGLGGLDVCYSVCYCERCGPRQRTVFVAGFLEKPELANQLAMKLREFFRGITKRPFSIRCNRDLWDDEIDGVLPVSP